MSDGWQFEAQYAMHMYYEKDGELEHAKHRIEQLERELSAEKALTDRLYDCWTGGCGGPGNPYDDYRKARGM